MNYEEALSYIHGAPRTGGRPNLDRIKLLLKRLGDPQKKLKFVHVAGTNGKGSTVAMTAAVLRAAGYRTGMYISPFVEDFRERMQLDGQLIPQEELAQAATEVRKEADRMKDEGNECPEFELVTATAMWWFARQACDIVVLEVGLGGRLDATNAIDPPEVCAICSISLDHTEYLGDTTAKIAGEKCGIIKPGAAVAAYPDLPDDAREVVERTCAGLGITPNILSLDDVTVLSCGENGSDMMYGGKRYHLSLTGEHQIKNALTVLAILQELQKRGWRIPQEAIELGLSHTGFGGRMEVVGHRPLRLIDGAHNREAIDMLCQNIDRLYSAKRLIVVMGMLRDKDFEQCVAQVARRASILVAATPPTPRAVPAAQVAALAEAAGAQVEICPDGLEAGELAGELAGEDDVVLACGSLYLIGDVKKGMLNRKG